MKKSIKIMLVLMLVVVLCCSLSVAAYADGATPSPEAPTPANALEVVGIASVAAITVICYLVGEGVKVSGLDNKWIPIIVGVFGGILGAVCMYIMPDYPAGDIVTAIAVGIVSGLAATGINQITKQLGN